MIANLILLVIVAVVVHHFVVRVPHKKAEALKEQIRKHEQANHNCRPKGAHPTEATGNLRTCSVCGQKWRYTGIVTATGAHWSEVK